MLIKIPKGWEIPEREVTPERIHVNRRKFLANAAAAAFAGGVGTILPSWAEASAPRQWLRQLRTKRNPEYTVDMPITSEAVATGYNNYYEFTEVKNQVHRLAADFESRPWEIEIRGQVAKERKIDVDDLIRQMGFEERVYRHRCVEAWSMTVPWIGFPMKKFVEWCAPKPEARFVRMVSFFKPGQAEGQRKSDWYPWPYHEALSLEEATNQMTLLTVGMYGKTLPNQNGSPLRLITPWKYGFKGIKGITKFEFVKKRPATFWNTVVPAEYDFWANIDPGKPHPRWSQASERVVETGERIPTHLYNGYGKYVAYLYEK